MINIVTSHNKIWSPETCATDIIKEYQTQGNAVLTMNSEGPCCDAVGLYRLLDDICAKFNFEKRRIAIITWNPVEQHDHYKILKRPLSWHKQTWQTSRRWGFDRDQFKNKKTFANLFGCVYNIPSWNRLCLLSYIKYHTPRPSLLACNGTWTAEQHNTYYLDTVADYCPAEFANIARIINDNPGPLPHHPLTRKPDETENTQILEYYNDFFVDVVAETYSNGLTFFPTEKTYRPMFGLTPFIIFGPQGFLEQLKGTQGFRTFSDYWPEDYDNYQCYDRIKKMYQTIDYISRKSDAELHAMYADMQPILEHNYQRLAELNE